MSHCQLFTPAIIKHSSLTLAPHKKPPLLIIFICTLFFIVLPGKESFAQAPLIEWQTKFGGASYDEAQSIVQTKDGGYIMAGWSHSNDAFATGNHSAGTGDCWIVKMDAVGNFQWQKMIGGLSYDDALIIKETADGGYIAAGHTTSNDGDVPGNYASSYDALVFKLDQNGTIQWVKNFGGYGYDAIISIEQTRDEGYIFAGFTESNNGNVTGNHGDYDGWMGKLDKNGNLQWQKCVGGSARDVAWSITLSPDGGYVFTGHSLSANGDIAANHGKYDVMTGKLDASGNLLWIKTFGGSQDEMSNSIVPASDGGYIIAAYSFSADGDVNINYGQNDVWIIKIDEQGNLLWQKSYGGPDYEDPYCIAPTSDGGYVVAARTRSVSGDVTANNGDNDYWILKLGMSGNLQWQETIGGSQQDIAHSIQQTADGGYIIAGTSYSIDGNAAGSSYGQSDAWIVKLGVCPLNTPATPGSIQGNAAPCTGAQVTYSIQPVTDAIGYNWAIPSGWAIVTGQGTTSITLTAGSNAGNIGVSAYNTCKTSGKNTSNVAPVNPVAAQVTINADAGFPACQGTTVLFTATTTAAVAPRYQWKKNGIAVGVDAATYSDNALKDADIIRCELTSTSACLGQAVVISQPVTVAILPLAKPTINIVSNATSICKGAEVQFTAAVSSQGSSPVYRWFVNNNISGGNTPGFTSSVLSDGDVVKCELVSNQACAVPSTAASNLVRITVDDKTKLTATVTASATTICKNGTVSFEAAAVNAGVSPAFQWSVNGVPAGTNAPVFTSSNFADGDEVACMVLPGANTCAVNQASTNKIQIIIHPLPQLLVYPTDTLVKTGTAIQLRTYISEDIRSFNWAPAQMLQSPGLLQPTTIPIMSATNLRLTISTRDGCPMYKDVVIKPYNSLYMPAAFTPDGDGKNDVFRVPPGTGVALTNFSIYNRWGKLVFTTADVNAGWNGTIKGEAQPMGAYIYTIAGFVNNKPVYLKGSVMLVR